MISAISFFWLFLATCFFVMAWRTYRLRQVTVPTSMAEAQKGAYFAGHDVTRLKPIFDEMLAVELSAFALTAISAFVEFMLSH